MDSGAPDPSATSATVSAGTSVATTVSASVAGESATLLTAMRAAIHQEIQAALAQLVPSPSPYAMPQSTTTAVGLHTEQSVTATTTSAFYTGGCKCAMSRPFSASGHVNSPMPRLDIGQLEDSVCFYLQQALAPATLRSYKSGQKRFLQFCRDAGLQPWPLTERLLCMFVAQLGKENLTHQSIKCYISAVRFLSVSTGHGDPFTLGTFPVLQYVLRGVKRIPKPPARTRLPVTPSILRIIKAQWTPQSDDVDYLMLWAACCVVFLGRGSSR